MADSPAPARRLLTQLGWLVTLWAAGVLGLGVVAALLRGLMALAGLTAN